MLVTLTGALFLIATYFDGIYHALFVLGIQIIVTAIALLFCSMCDVFVRLWRSWRSSRRGRLADSILIVTSELEPCDAIEVFFVVNWRRCRIGGVDAIQLDIEKMQPQVNSGCSLPHEFERLKEYDEPPRVVNSRDDLLREISNATWLHVFGSKRNETHGF